MYGVGRCLCNDGGVTGRILVVDDDPALAEMLTIVLQGEGYAVGVCADGTSALAAYRDVGKCEVAVHIAHGPAYGFGIEQHDSGPGQRAAADFVHYPALDILGEDGLPGETEHREKECEEDCVDCFHDNVWRMVPGAKLSLHGHPVKLIPTSVEKRGMNVGWCRRVDVRMNAWAHVHMPAMSLPKGSI